MIEFIKKLHAARKQRLRDEQFDEGFGWAMAQYHLHGESLLVLENYAQLSIDFNESHLQRAFDDGVMEAVHLLRSQIENAINNNSYEV